MTDILPPDLVSQQTPHSIAAPRKSSAPIIVICWIIILAIVGLEVRSNLTRASTAADTPADNPMLSAAGQCVIGAHVLDPGSQKNGQTDAMDLLITQMESVAKTSSDQLRIAIVCKEVDSPERANGRLRKLDQSHDLTPAVRADLNTVRTIYQDGAAAITQEQRQTLEDHQGWFADVALSFGLPDDSPVRSKMLSKAKHAFVIASGGSTLGLVAVLLGAGLTVLAIVLVATGKLRLLFRRGPPDSVFLEAFAVYLAGFVVLSLLLHFIVHSAGLGWTLVLTIVLPIAVAWPVVRGKPWSQMRMELGWHSGRGIFREIGCGVVGYIAALPLLAVMLVITLQLIRLSGTTPSHPVVSFLNGGPGEIVLIYFIACIWAPVFEESMFRGALFNHLRARHGWWISAGIVGLLFAAVHPQGWTTIPVLGGIGMVLCALREWRGSLIASMAAHAMSNGMVITLALLTSR